MPVDIGGPGDRRRVAFGGSDDSDELIHKYDSEGIDSFPEDHRGISMVIKRRELFIHALGDYGSAESLAKALGLRDEFVIRVAWYWRADSEGLVREPPNEHIRPTTAPWNASPHPDTVAEAGGGYSKKPWGE